MCGIFGGISKGDIVTSLIDGIATLEYRGYDSAGIAVMDSSNSINTLKVCGKINLLREELTKTSVNGNLGIAHTRWATHGKPSVANAHPHCYGDIAVVHNGIIENHTEIRQELEGLGINFVSQTDSEIVANYLGYLCKKGSSVKEALNLLLGKISGAYAFAIMHNKEPEVLYVAKQGSPLVIGFGDSGQYIASDSLALFSFASSFIALNDGDTAIVSVDNVTVYDKQDKEVTREKNKTNFESQVVTKEGYKHFMLKEIFEQPNSILATIKGKVLDGKLNTNIFSNEDLEVLTRVKNICIVACGTSYHAGLIAKYWLEGIAGVSVQVEVASEFRYRKKAVIPGSLLLTTSQSGETADTLAALKNVSSDDYISTLAVCNVASSSLVRESKMCILTAAGPEIGVASTKAFTSQLIVLYLFSLLMAKQRGVLVNEEDRIADVNLLPHKLNKALQSASKIKNIAHKLKDSSNIIYVARGDLSPIAYEGALKLKEISYIHAESYPAGELKHGPLALIDEHMPVVAIARNNGLQHKLNSNLEEILSRGGKIILFAEEGVEAPNDKNVEILSIPRDVYLSPIIATVPLQLLSYYIASIKGMDVDQPRNLAKSVTVE